MNPLQARVTAHFAESIAAKQQAVEVLAEPTAEAAQLMINCLMNDGKILVCGNGGSAADAQHFAAEMTGRFEKERMELAAIALTTDTSALTAIGNDFSFNEVFSKQIQALAQPGDILLGISTSGNSDNIIQAFAAAKEKKVYCLGLAGRDGGKMKALCDTCFIVEDTSTALIQEVHITLGHLLCELTDYYLFENTTELTPYLQGEKTLPL